MMTTAQEAATKKPLVLVTGGAGYIGSHTAVELVGAGYGVVIADDLSNSEAAAVEGVRHITGVEVPFERVDCNDAGLMGELFRKYDFDAVIHFAAFKAVGGSVAEPLEYYRNNIGSLVTVLESMRAAGVGNIVFSSSATVYGQPDVLPATEEAPRKPATSPYGNTKQICEDILRDSVAAYGPSATNGSEASEGSGASERGLRGISLRYFNPIGAHPSALIGELPRGVPNNLIPFITQTAAGIRPELSIFGDDYDTPDGTALRDYIDVVDLARAHVVAVGRMLGRGENAGGDDKSSQKGMRSDYEIFNIGTGRPVSVMELVKTFEKVNDLKLNYKMAPRRVGDVEAVWADTSLAETELGWRAVRPLDETLRSAWQWQQALER